MQITIVAGTKETVDFIKQITSNVTAKTLAEALVQEMQGEANPKIDQASDGLESEEKDV